MADVQKFLDNQTGLPTLWACIKDKFVAKEAGKGLSTEDFTTALKNKLDSIDPEAVANQNAFSNVKVGATTIAAAAETDTVEFAAGANVTLTPDAATKKVTIAATDTTYNEATTSNAGLLSAADKTKLAGIAEGAEVNQNAFAKVTANGTDISASSKSASFEIEGGTNVTVTGNASTGKVTIAATDTTYSEATTSVPGLMSAADKTKLDDIDASADVNVIEVIKVNGSAQTVADKAVDIAVPTNNNQLTNGAGYQTASDVQTAINAAIAGAYIYKGSVAAEGDLPASGNTAGDVYNITAASTYGPAGMNVAWTGTQWDALGSSISIDAMTAAEIQAICI